MHLWILFILGIKLIVSSQIFCCKGTIFFSNTMHSLQKKWQKKNDFAGRHSRHYYRQHSFLQGLSEIKDLKIQRFEALNAYSRTSLLERSVSHTRGSGDGGDECRDCCDDGFHQSVLQSFRYFPFHCLVPPFVVLGTNFANSHEFYLFSSCASHSPPFKGRGRGGVCNSLSASLLSVSHSPRRKDTDPTPSRLRPTVALLPNRSLLAIAYKGGELLRLRQQRPLNLSER